jgi:hypothetical protein
VTTPQPEQTPLSTQKQRDVRLGELECPRCHESFTVGYWVGGLLIQARCLSCDLKWPLPHVV